MDEMLELLADSITPEKPLQKRSFKASPTKRQCPLFHAA